MKAWMIKTPDGDGVIVAKSQQSAWIRAEIYYQVARTDLIKQGYRCVRVTIKEEK